MQQRLFIDLLFLLVLHLFLLVVLTLWFKTSVYVKMFHSTYENNVLIQQLALKRWLYKKFNTVLFLQYYILWPCFYNGSVIIIECKLLIADHLTVLEGKIYCFKLACLNKALFEKTFIFGILYQRWIAFLLFSIQISKSQKRYM